MIHEIHSILKVSKISVSRKDVTFLVLSSAAKKHFSDHNVPFKEFGGGNKPRHLAEDTLVAFESGKRQMGHTSNLLPSEY
jgi:hypothetical protein